MTGSAAFLAAVFPAAALLVATACSRQQPKGAIRTAVLRFENLTGDTEFKWAERGAAEMVAREIGAEARTAPEPGSSAQRAQAIAGGAARIVTGAIGKAGNRLRLDVWTEDAASGARDSVSVAGEAGAGIAPLAHAAARKMGASGSAFPQTNAGTLRDYFVGLDASTPPDASAALARAASADPNFGPAWIAWSEIELARGDRASGVKILGQARAHAGSFAPLDKARLEVVTAQAASNGPAALRALQELSKLTPNDPLVWRSMGDVAMNTRQPRAAAEAYARAAVLQPADPLLRNVLGYARSAAGDLDGAVKAIEEYRQLRPNDANAFDSLGDVYYRFGKFAEAEKAYVEAGKRDQTVRALPALGKSALARLMTGDVVGADRLFSKAIEAVRAAKEPAAEFRLANWEFLTGRRKEGLARLETFAAATGNSPLRDLGSIAYSQLTLWNLQLGNGTGAEQAARKAAATASTPGTAHMAAVCGVLAGVKGTPMNRNALAQASGYGLLLSRQFAPAVLVMKDLHSRAGLNPDDDAAVMLAWAQLASGQPGNAGALLGPTPIPQLARPNPFQAFTFPRIVFLRAQAAELAGRGDEALRHYRLFVTLSGPTPFIFGEEKLAREKLN